LIQEEILNEHPIIISNQYVQFETERGLFSFFEIRTGIGWHRFSLSTVVADAVRRSSDHFKEYQCDIPSFIGSLGSGYLEVSSEDWTQLKWDFAISEGRTARFSLALYVKGVIDIDDAVLSKGE